MATKSWTIQQLDQYGLCLGCGLCESICGHEQVSMQLGNDGFFHPKVKQQVDHQKEAIISRICPGLNVVNDLTFTKEERIWGKMQALYAGYASDTETRTKGSSGGVISAIAIHALETKAVDAVLQVGGDRNDYERNALRISKTRADVLQCASSRYAPALIFSKILEILASNEDTYCFIGKPCDISALKNFLKEYPQYNHRFQLKVAILCAGMPSFKGTRAIVENFEAVPPVTDLAYRGNGWPGYFSFIDSRKKQYQLSYNDSWGKTLNQHLHFRCKLCPEGIGIQADIAVGDAWETSDGYPDFTEREGQSLVIVRTKEGAAFIQQAQKQNSLSLQTLDPEKIKLMQPYQYNRRLRAASRKLAFFVGSGKQLNFKKLQLFQTFLSADKWLLLKDFRGTLRRVRAKMSCKV
ncbi:Coenzyme F420 hydrogenase/dehydrogenase, beta subunit C-terminal domain [Olivibacter ginsenosidimutans]|uniref:Coenzyme F420 hydrogenase/dehydrogenase, beta subunit C-terminal domain n=1 Tax=Olivibacter ginsenosidimutans TaxID=1176537 RepID=A0ABP9AET8_9SPHI